MTNLELDTKVNYRKFSPVALARFALANGWVKTQKLDYNFDLYQGPVECEGKCDIILPQHYRFDHDQFAKSAIAAFAKHLGRDKHDIYAAIVASKGD